MENLIDIYNLLPNEVQELMIKLTNALEAAQTRKDTNANFTQKQKETIECPTCASHHLIKNGHDKNHVQRFCCKDCNKNFNACTNTFVAHTKLTYQQVQTFFDCMNNKLSIKKTAILMHVNNNTVFLLRHKVLDCILEIRKSVSLNGIIEADETYKSINLKGTKKENMPRYSKSRSSKGGSKRGISNHQVCIASAIDEYDNCFLEIVDTGPITSVLVENVFQNKIKKATCLVTDCKSSYEKFAFDNNIHLEQVKSGTYKNQNGYSLGNINSLHSELSTFLSYFRGVSTKHLQHYLDWFSFQKIINYTIEILKQPFTMLKKAVVNKCSINSNNVYDNSSGIDFKEVYEDNNIYRNYFYQSFLL